MSAENKMGEPMREGMSGKFWGVEAGDIRPKADQSNNGKIKLKMIWKKIGEDVARWKEIEQDRRK